MYVETDLGESFNLDTEFASGGEARIWTLRREPDVLGQNLPRAIVPE